MHTDGGCSRTNPVTWLGVAGQNLQVQVKREPQQVHMSELVAVKLEQASPGNKPEHPAPAIPASLNNGQSRFMSPWYFDCDNTRDGNTTDDNTLAVRDMQQHYLTLAAFCLLNSREVVFIC